VNVAAGIGIIEEKEVVTNLAFSSINMGHRAVRHSLTFKAVITSDKSIAVPTVSTGTAVIINTVFNRNYHAVVNSVYSHLVVTNMTSHASSVPREHDLTV